MVSPGAFLLLLYFSAIVFSSLRTEGEGHPLTCGGMRASPFTLAGPCARARAMREGGLSLSIDVLIISALDTITARGCVRGVRLQEVNYATRNREKLRRRTRISAAASPIRARRLSHRPFRLSTLTWCTSLRSGRKATDMVRGRSGFHFLPRRPSASRSFVL